MPRLALETVVVCPDPGANPTDERCSNLEAWKRPQAPAFSNARAKVSPGESTRPPRLRGVIERYGIVEGQGAVILGEAAEKFVGPGDVVIFPSASRSASATSACDRVFSCV